MTGLVMGGSVDDEGRRQCHVGGWYGRWLANEVQA